ncbi:MAG: DoxX family membrane protein [Acidobacteriota bacterium]
MNELISIFRRTNDSKITIAPRLIAALPLIVIGIGHLVDPGSFRLILDGSGIPMPGVNQIIAPVVEVAAGVLLLLGLVARAGGLAAASTMLVALYSHAVIDPSTLPETMAMPPLVLPLAVLVSALWVAYTGAGRWSMDSKA